MDFLLNIRVFKEEKLGQGEHWRERTQETIVENQCGVPTNAPIFLRQSRLGICSQPLEMLGELEPESTLSKPRCQKTHRSWPGQLARFHLLLVATQALFSGMSV